MLIHPKNYYRYNIIKFNFRKEGYLEASMNVNPVDGAYDARIQIYHLYLNPFLKRIQEYAEVSVVEGLVDSDLLLTGNINEWENARWICDCPKLQTDLFGSCNECHSEAPGGDIDPSKCDLTTFWESRD